MFNTQTDDRGQVGIGTLIVFIAMVLVAAIAAGVLINTAGLLQSQAESTGQESTDQVSNSLSVQSVTGEVVHDDGGDDTIAAVAIDVSLGPGSNPIDLADATVSWTGEQNSATFVIDPVSDVDGEDFNSSTGGEPDSNAVVDDSNTALENTGDSQTIYIVADNDDVEGDWYFDLDGDNSLENDMPMNEGDSASVTITTADGGQTFTSINVPDLLEEGEGVRL